MINNKKLLPKDIEIGRAEIQRIRHELSDAKIKSTTKAEYLARIARFQRDGVSVIQGVGKRELALWKAAIKWNSSQAIRKAMRAADEIWKGRRIEEKLDGDKVKVHYEPWATEAERWNQWRAAYAEIQAKFNVYEDTKNRLKKIHPERDKAKAKRQADHKKKALKPEQINQLFEAVPKNSKYRIVFIAASMCGARPEEFADGVSIRTAKDKNGKLGLHFTILRRAKCAEKKGLKTGEIFISIESLSGGMKERAKELIKKMKTDGGETLVQVQPSKTRTTGQVLTQAIRPFANKLNFPVSFYSLRHSFAAAAKSSAATAGLSPDDAAIHVAEMMGHQSTATQKHYGRSNRGKGEFSPASAKEPSNEIRNKTSRRPGSEGCRIQKAQKAELTKLMSVKPTLEPPKPKRL